MVSTEKLSFRNLGVVVCGILLLLLLINAIPWATKEESAETKAAVRELNKRLEIWYGTLQPRVIRIEEKLDNIKDTIDKIEQRTHNNRDEPY